jgi:hypothetical protein
VTGGSLVRCSHGAWGRETENAAQEAAGCAVQRRLRRRRGRRGGSQEAAAERRAGGDAGAELPGGAKAGDRPEGAPGCRARARSQAGRRLVPEPPRAPQKQATRGGVRQAQAVARRRHPPQMPPRERGTNPKHGAFIRVLLQFLPRLLCSSSCELIEVPDCR